MSQKIEIDVAAKLDPKPAEATAKQLGKTLDAVGRKPIQLVPDEEVKKLKDVDALWRRYLALDKKLAAGVRSTAQAGLPFAQVDLAKAGANPNKIARIAEFVNGGMLPKASSVLADAAVQAAGAAAHPVAPAGTPAARGSAGAPGGSTPAAPGMSAGFGAGLMGLVGGIAALGVSKLVGAVTENIEKAENNNIAYDKLKRTLGDVNVSFNTLKSVITQTGDGLKLTYGDTAQLAAQYVKAGGLKDGDFRALPEELGLGVGLSRAYGLDPSQGVGALGAMRGVGATRDTQETRRMAILIGETIAKSDAFSKADEVMEAIANFTVSQTRQSFSAANTQAYAGMLAGAVSSGTPGLDPTGAAGLLAKVNASLAAGGGKGEASQFFTSQLGAARGMNVFQTQLWREGGAFATADSVFGGDSAVAEYYRRNGLEGPKGSETLMSATLDRIRKKYSDPEMRLNAAAGHLTGGNMSAAAALLNIDPKEMGELEKYLGSNGLKGASASGINNAARAVSGTADDRRAIADKLLSRNDVSEGDKAQVRAAMGSGSEEKQKEVLAQLSAQYEQERTMGKDISDSRALLDNVKATLASEVLPVLQDSRKALLYLAGVGDGKTPAEILGKVDKVMAEERANANNKETREILDQRSRLGADRRAGRITPEEYDAGMEQLRQRQDALKQRRALEAQAAALKAGQMPVAAAAPAATATPDAGTSPTGAPSPSTGGDAARPSSDPGKPTGGAPGAATAGKPSARVDAFVKEYGPLADKIAKEKNVPADAVLGQWGLETGWGKSVIPGTNNLGNIKDLSWRGPTAKDNMTGSVDSYRSYGSADAFGADFMKLLDKQRYSGVKGSGDPKQYFSALKSGGYAEDPNYVNKGVAAAGMVARARRSADTYKTPIPDLKSSQAPGGAGTGTGLSREALESYFHLSADEIKVRVESAPGIKAVADDAIQTRIDAPHASSNQRFSVKP